MSLELNTKEKFSFSESNPFVIVRKSDFKGKINQLWLQGVGCISQMISYGMNDNEDDYMLRSTIKALEDTLTRQKDRGEYYERRKLLGLA